MRANAVPRSGDEDLNIARCIATPCFAQHSDIAPLFTKVNIRFNVYTFVEVAGSTSIEIADLQALEQSWP